MTSRSAPIPLRARPAADPPVKILHLTRKYPPRVGGMERMNHQLVEALRPRADLQLVAWGRSQWGLPAFALAAAVQVTARLARRATRPDVLCLGDAALAPLGRALARPFRVPVIAIAHGLDITYPRWGYPAVVLPALRRCDRVICVSRFTADACAARGVPAGRLRVIPNGIPPPPPVPARAAARAELIRRGWPVSPDAPFVLTVGRLVPRKGVAAFIGTALPALLQRHPALVYGVIGQGPDEAAVRQAIAQTQTAGHVFLRGRLDDETVRLAYAAADLFLMPNRPVPGNPEGFGIVALEASGFGLPVVATAVEGLVDAVRDGVNGRSLPPHQPLEFARAVAALLEAPPVLERLRETARAFAREHLWEQIAVRYLDVFQEVAAGPGARP